MLCFLSLGCVCIVILSARHYAQKNSRDWSHLCLETGMLLLLLRSCEHRSGGGGAGASPTGRLACACVLHPWRTAFGQAAVTWSSSRNWDARGLFCVPRSPQLQPILARPVPPLGSFSTLLPCSLQSYVLPCYKVGEQRASLLSWASSGS